MNWLAYNKGGDSETIQDGKTGKALLGKPVKNKKKKLISKKQNGGVIDIQSLISNYLASK